MSLYLATSKWAYLAPCSFQGCQEPRANVSWIWGRTKALAQQSLSWIAASRDVSAWQDLSRTVSSWLDSSCTYTLLPKSREGETSLQTG